MVGGKGGGARGHGTISYSLPSNKISGYGTSKMISLPQLANVEKVTEELFTLPKEVKQLYARGSTDSNNGWVALEREQ